MLQGLKMMSKAELQEVGKLMGVDQATLAKLSTEILLDDVILAWVAKTAGSPKDVKNHPKLQKEVLEWLAKDFGLPVLSDLDDLERSIRIKIAADSAEYLSPSWRLACALIAMGPADAIPVKLEMLDRAASLAVPSRGARAALLQEWRDLCAQWSDGRDVVPELKPILESLKQQRKEKIEHALTLAITITFADGRFSVEEEQLYKFIADEVGMPAEEANQLVRRVNNLFWDQQTQVGPKRIEHVTPEQEKNVALEAARRTLEASGSLEGLMLETRDQVGASTGSGSGEHAAAAPKKGILKMFGALTGLSQYLNSRQRSPEHVLLARIAYLAILRQHQHAVASMPAPIEEVAPTAPVEAAPAPEAAPEPAPRRVIKLP